MPGTADCFRTLLMLTQEKKFSETMAETITITINTIMI